MTNPDMTYDWGELSHADTPAATFGLRPGVAGVHMEHQADVYCPTCAEDLLYGPTWERLREGNVGYDHPEADAIGNVAAVLASEEWDCPGARCGHCAVPLDVKVAHYDAVCQPDTCPVWNE